MTTRLILAYILTLMGLSTSDERVVSYLAEKDRIPSLPGASAMPRFAMYSGYLDVSENKKLHYWLNICEEDTCDDLIVWFNGGPGCSSLDGLFVEHGPIELDETTGQPVRNMYSWNKLAHTLYIESPVGVGFSYGEAEEPLNDNTTAEDALKALLNFFEKFDSLNDCDLYISGESYAGVYVPILVTTILDSQPLLADRIQGLLIGNGLLNARLNDQSLIYYAYFHGLYGDDIWDELMYNCCEDSRLDRCDFFQFKKPKCMMQITEFTILVQKVNIPNVDDSTVDINYVMKVMQIVINGGLNIYNLYDCATDEQLKRQRYFQDSLIELFQKDYAMQLRSSFSLSPPCYNSSSLTRYLNRNKVQRAIHVRSTTWEVCSDKVHANYKRLHPDMSPYLKRILHDMDDVRVMLYFGDVDMACNHLGGEWFANNLNIKETMPRRTWSVERHGTDQVAGYVKEFDKLIFVTVKGAGHMVPMVPWHGSMVPCGSMWFHGSMAPQAAFQMIQRFLDYEPL